MNQFVLTREELKNVLLSYQSFMGVVARKLIERGVDIATLTHDQTDHITDDFIDRLINETTQSDEM